MGIVAAGEGAEAGAGEVVLRQALSGGRQFHATLLTLGPLRAGKGARLPGLDEGSTLRAETRTVGDWRVPW